jgi:hypothetical protein
METTEARRLPRPVSPKEEELRRAQGPFRSRTIETPTLSASQ